MRQHWCRDCTRLRLDRHQGHVRQERLQLVPVGRGPAGVQDQGGGEAAARCRLPMRQHWCLRRPWVVRVGEPPTSRASSRVSVRGARAGVDRCVCRRILYNVCALLCVGVCWGLRCLPARPNATPLTHSPASSRVLAGFSLPAPARVRSCGKVSLNIRDFSRFQVLTTRTTQGEKARRGEARRKARGSNSETVK